MFFGMDFAIISPVEGVVRKHVSGTMRELLLGILRMRALRERMMIRQENQRTHSGLSPGKPQNEMLTKRKACLLEQLPIKYLSER